MGTSCPAESSSLARVLRVNSTTENMGDGYWNIRPHVVPLDGMLKRPRTDYAQDDDRGGPQIVKDTKAIGSAYDRYLQNARPPLTSGEASNYGGIGLGRAVSAGVPAFSRSDPVSLGRPMAGPDFAPNGRGMEFGGRLPDEMARPGREIIPLPPDASSTLYIEGLPSDSTKREVSHIFRPFIGYKEVRLVSKESKHRGGDPLILCFVDFIDPACATTALSALQGYKMDEHDPDSPYLRLQFSKFPGPRSGSGPRGKR